MINLDHLASGAGLVGWADSVARSYLSESIPNRWAHVQSAGNEARRIAQAVAPDGDLLVATAILHDVGYAPELANVKFHAVDGARYLREIGTPVRICALVAHHSYAAREARMRKIDSLLAEFEDEATPLRDALWYCDMVTGPNGERVTFEQRTDEIQRRYGPGSLVSEFIRAAHSELAGAVERTQARMKASGIDHPK